MPKLNDVKDLQKLCFDLISQNLFTLCLKERFDEIEEDVHEVINYLKKYLPAKLLLEVCDYLRALCDKVNINLRCFLYT